MTEICGFDLFEAQGLVKRDRHVNKKLRDIYKEIWNVFRKATFELDRSHFVFLFYKWTHHIF